MGDVVVGISGVKCAWATTLRGYINDHVASMSAISLRDPAAVIDGEVEIDVLVVDDAVCLFDATDVGAAGQRDIRCIGLHDALQGRGETYLRDLGVDLVMSTDTPPAEIVESIRRLAPTRAAHRPTPSHDRGLLRHRDLAATTAALALRPSAPMTIISGTSGGVGTSETTILLAQRSAERAATLVVEADELAPSMASRLGLQPDRNLNGALALVAQGHPPFPECLTPGRDDGAPHPDIRFDVIAGPSNPGGPPPANPIHFRRLIDAATGSYGEVLVEIGPVISSTGDSAHDRFAAGRAVVAAADRLVAIAAPTPDGVTRLLNWLSVVRTLAPDTPAWAAFGLIPRSRFVRTALHEGLRHRLVGTSLRGFEAIHLLPVEPVSAKAAWNGVLVPRGGLRRAVNALADQISRIPAQPRAHLDPPAPVTSNGHRPVRAGS
jgi:MinD-like ATPase involved in chromosome partitioning or flagellar assembly